MPFLHSGYVVNLFFLDRHIPDGDLDGRFLVSFAGKYLRCDYCVPSMCGDSEGVTASSDHQLLKIYVPRSEPDLYGPAFIEVGFELLFHIVVFNFFVPPLISY